jgi:tetraacyldisaccharide-1-P 4'-kinase
VYAARHVHTGLRSAAAGSAEPPDLPAAALAGRSFFAAAGIANPASLETQLGEQPGRFAGSRWFADHHRFTQSDLDELRRQARAAGADVLLVTEKDWMKLRELKGATDGEPPVWRLELEIHMDPAATAGLLELIQARLEARR